MRRSPVFSKQNGRAHCGKQIGGSYLYTLTLTDIVTGWTECLPLLHRSPEAVLAAFQRARTLFPFPIVGLDTDNGGEAHQRESGGFLRTRTHHVHAWATPTEE